MVQGEFNHYRNILSEKEDDDEKNQWFDKKENYSLDK